MKGVNEMKKIFSKALYFEGLRRTKNLTVALLIVALVWAGIAFAAMTDPSDTACIINNNVVAATSYVLPFYIYVMGIGLALSAFSFLNKRNASDFWHAVPYTRTSLYISTLAACVTQMLIVIVSVLLLPGILASIFGYEFYWYYLPNAFLTSLAGTMLVTAVTAFAMTITGTAFANVITALTILFLPRFILILAGSIVQYRIDTIESWMFGIFLNPKYNIPVGQIASLAEIGGSFEGIYTCFGSFLYTFILSILYTVGGTFLFRARKSEKAGNSSTGKVLQTVTRCAIGLVFGLLLTYALIIDGLNDWIEVSILFAMSFLPFLLYELITTRSLKKMVKCIPTYGFVIAACLLFYAGVMITVGAMLAFSPSPSQIASIQVTRDYNQYGEVNSYREYLLYNAKITDERAIELAADALKSNNDDINNDRSIGYGGWEVITFNLKSGASVTRIVKLSEADDSKLNYLISNDEAYRKAAVHVAEASEFMSIKPTYNISGLTDEETAQLWDSYITEGEIQSYSGYYFDYGPESDIVFRITAIKHAGYKFIRGYAEISPSSTPETAEMLLGMIAENSKTKTSLHLLQSENYNLHIDVSPMNQEYYAERMEALNLINYDGYGYYRMYDGTEIKKLGMLDGMETAKKFGKTTVRIHWTQDSKNRYVEHVVYVDLTPENYDALLEYSYKNTEEPDIFKEANPEYGKSDATYSDLG